MSKSITCCFTEHRPSSLPWHYDEQGSLFNNFRSRFKEEIIKAILEGYTHFISGMALGVDIIAAEIVLMLKSKYKGITLECAIPCRNQCDNWVTGKDRYQSIINKADKVTLVCDSDYYDGCMAKRNKYMVDNSNKVIAVFNGRRGGTQQTINMAKKAGLDVVIINPYSNK